MKPLLGTGLIVLIFCSILSKVQSPDSRICNCYSSVSSEFMLATRAFYGSIGIALTRNMELKPAESQNVMFLIPQFRLSKVAAQFTESILLMRQVQNFMNQKTAILNSVMSFPIVVKPILYY